ncbi:MAG: hypothetical protein MUO31_07325 [Thermodesulfovibrionales bacterium]|nr:hypothetical protein [Thermodesulfovibrionales bacterium]
MTPKAIKNFFILFLLFIIFFSFSTDLAMTKKGGFFSDESTYFAMMQSLAFDGDLQYTRADIIRIREYFYVGPMGLFLKKGKDGRLFYAKSFIYPLAAAPFFRLAGNHGILLFNGLMIFAVLLMGFLLLQQYHDPGKSFAFTLIYIFASITFIYIWWITADLFNFFVNFTALFFFFYKFKKPSWNVLSGVFFALAVFSKPNNLLHIGLLFLLLLFQNKWKKFLILALAFLLVLAALFYFNYSQTGSLNYQGGERRSFYGEFPFERPDFAFAGGHQMSTDTYWTRFYISPTIVVLNLFYYVFGRFTGMFIYFFPAFFLLLLIFFQKKYPEDYFLLGGIVLAILFYVLLMPDNYFGGGGSLGNRYFLNIFPLFFFLGYRGRIFKFLLLPVFAAVFFLAPVYMDSMYHSAFPRFPGVQFPVKCFPAEKTQFATLPSNTNPRAFNKKIGNQYTLFFLNDNYNPIEGDTFWTYADKELELFLLAPKPVKDFIVQLKNTPLDNQVSFQIDHKKKTVFIKAESVRVITFSKIPGLRVDRRYIYHIKIRSARSFCPYFSAKTATMDRRLLGVQTHIKLTY